MQRRTICGVEFLNLILQHVLPKGFRRAPNFGFLHPNSKQLIQLLQLQLKLAPKPFVAELNKRPALRCPCCGGEIKVVRTRIKPLFTLNRASENLFRSVAGQEMAM